MQLGVKILFFVFLLSSLEGSFAGGYVLKRVKKIKKPKEEIIQTHLNFISKWGLDYFCFELSEEILAWDYFYKKEKEKEPCYKKKDESLYDFIKARYEKIPERYKEDYCFIRRNIQFIKLDNYKSECNRRREKYLDKFLLFTNNSETKKNLMNLKKELKRRQDARKNYINIDPSKKTDIFWYEIIN